MKNGKSIDPEEFRSDQFIMQILRYVVDHPQAKDSVSGIEKWWLAQTISRETKKRLEDTLNLLVVKGWLSGRSSPQADTIYSLNEHCLTEINEFLGRK